jgi:ribosomal protein L30/L7E
MKKAALLLALLLSSGLYQQSASAQIFKKLISAAKGSTTGTPSELEIGSALKQALEQGTGKSSDQLSAVDGFFGNAAVKILFPPEAQKAEKTLRSLGLNKLCDDVILSLNRAAEGAAKEAKPIFIDAIKQMTLQDVTNILLGQQDAATQYFKRATTIALVAKFKPIIQVSLDKTNATRYYTSAATSFNKVPFVKKINPDISDYVTQKAIDGLFIQIAIEELNIRQNLSARTTPLMQKVFSFAQSAKK